MQIFLYGNAHQCFSVRLPIIGRRHDGRRKMRNKNDANIRNAIDRAFPASRFPVDQNKRLSKHFSSRCKVTLIRGGIDNGLPNAHNSKQYSAYEIEELNGTRLVSELIAEHSLALPLNVCLSANEHTRLFPVEIAQRIVLAVAAISPDTICVHEGDPATETVLCFDAVEIAESDTACEALSMLVEIGAVNLVYSDIPSIEASACQMIPLPLFTLRPRGNIVWHGKVPKFIEEQNKTIDSAVIRESFVEAISMQMSSLFGFPHDTSERLSRSAEQEARTISRVVEEVACGAIHIDERIFDAPTLVECNDIINSCQLREFVNAHVSFDNYAYERQEAIRGLSDTDMDYLTKIIECWEKVVVSDMPAGRLPNIGCSGIMGCDLAALHELSKTYRIRSYIVAITNGIPIKDLMLDEIARSNRKRRSHES